MSRVALPVSKFTHAVRRISSSATAARPSGILDSQARQSYLPRRLSDLKSECSKRLLKTSGKKSELVERLAAYDLIRSHSTLGGHRPIPVKPLSPLKIGHFMQGFQTSAPKQAVGDRSTIDFFFFPEVPEPPPKNPFAKLRVPLLPDNYSPDRSASSAHGVEALDEAVPRPEISIIASHPENIAPAAMSEVVGNDGIDIDIEHLTAGFSSSALKELKEPGMLKELWNSLIDDIFGSKASPHKAAV